MLCDRVSRLTLCNATRYLEGCWMYCRVCGSQLDDQAVVCVTCGSPPYRGLRHCQRCGALTVANAVVCASCGVGLGTVAPGAQAKSKLVAGLLGIFLGEFGIHRLYLGHTAIGVIQLILGLLGFVTCGITAIVSGLWGLIEGILILTGSISQDGQGRPLTN